MGKAPKSRNNDSEKGVVFNFCWPLAEQGHVLAFDCIFTSIDLLDKLKSYSVAGCVSGDNNII